MRNMMFIIATVISIASSSQDPASKYILPQVSLNETKMSEADVAYYYNEHHQMFATFSLVQLPVGEMVLWRNYCLESIQSIAAKGNEDMAGLRKYLNSSGYYEPTLTDGKRLTIPCCVQKIRYKNKEAWLILNNWEIYLSKEPGLYNVAHIMLVIIRAKDGKVLYFTQCG